MSSVSEILGPGGRIAARLANYEHRQEQLAMAEAVTRAIEDKHHLIAEAGTGVGKSFPYRPPPTRAATADQGEPKNLDAEEQAPKKRIIIPPHTITWQEKLLQKALPLLRSVMPQEFTAVLV